MYERIVLLSQPQCIECGSENLVMADEWVCKDCAVVQGQIFAGIDIPLSGYAASDYQDTTIYEDVLRACNGFGTTSRVDLNFGSAPRGVSQKTIAIASKDDAKYDLPHFSLRCSVGVEIDKAGIERHGLTDNMKRTAMEIFSLFIERCQDTASINTRGASVYAAVCMFYAAKVEGFPRSDLEMATLFQVAMNLFNAVSTAMLQAMASHGLYSKMAARLNPVSLIPWLLSHMDATDEMRKAIRGKIYCQAFMDAASKLSEGRMGNAVAAALLSIASGGSISIQQLKAPSGVGITTLRDVLNEAKRLLND